MNKPWYQSKTIWTAIGGIVVALTAYFTDGISLSVTVVSIFGAVEAIFLRDAMPSDPTDPNLPVK